jgi:hypothetical protein
MSIGPVLVATQRPLASHWQLAAPDESLAFLIVGWSLPPAPDRDDGIPKVVAIVLAKAMLRVGKLTYPRSSAPPSSPNTQSRLMKPRGIGEHLSTALGSAPSTFWAVTTTEPEVASDLFDDAGFPWWLQGQGALISRGESLPALDRATLLAATDPAFTVTQADLSALGAVALVRAGVDGDVAGIASSNRDVEAELVSSLAAAASEARLGWLLLDEEAFARALSDAGRAEVEHRLTRTLKLT